MSEIKLTKDTYKFLCLIYKEYLEKHETFSRDTARHFSYIPKSIYSEIPKDDCDSCLSELKNNNLIFKYVDGGFYLTDLGIITMETRFKDKISEITDFVSKFIP